MSVEVEKSVEKPTAAKEKRKPKDKPKKLTKVIIRRLPPTMDEETFRKQIDPLPDHEYFYFVAADWSLGHDATCRAYVNLINQDDVFLFRDRFDGYVFVDTKGAEYPAVVEFAPFQGLPKSKSRKHDPKCNSIETDLHYQAFLDNLQKEAAEANKQETKMEFTLPAKNNENQVTCTPLLQYLANKKQEKKDEQKRRVEEKRKQREEERQRKKDKLAKSMPKTIKEEGKEEAGKDDEARKKSRDKEAQKEPRSKRRADRDAKRKQEREKTQKPKPEKTEGPPARSENVEEEGDKKREIKKYSESRRDKRKSRNAAKEDEQVQDQKIVPENKPGKVDDEPSTSTAQIEKSKNDEQNTESPEMSETVKEFIKSVANIKEFVPRNRESANDSLSTDTTKSNATDLNEVKSKLEQLALKDEKLYNTDLEQSLFEKQEMGEHSGVRETSDSKERSRNRDEKGRRIRNKDRPSIEIYQPGRMRMTSKKEDGRSSVELKEYKSNSTSDGESVKRDKEENPSVRVKKVSRYSERRSSRTKAKVAGEPETQVDEDKTTPNDNSVTPEVNEEGEKVLNPN